MSWSKTTGAAARAARIVQYTVHVFLSRPVPRVRGGVLRREFAARFVAVPATTALAHKAGIELQHFRTTVGGLPRLADVIRQMKPATCAPATHRVLEWSPLPGGLEWVLHLELARSITTDMEHVLWVTWKELVTPGSLVFDLPVAARTSALAASHAQQHRRTATQRYDVWYHGTTAAAMTAISREGLRPSTQVWQQWGPPRQMLGGGIYLAPFAKALRHALSNHTGEARRQPPAVVRAIVSTGRLTVSVLGAGSTRRCDCRWCGMGRAERMRPFVDHDAQWQRDGATALRLLPCPSSRLGEIVVAAPRRHNVHVASVQFIDADTAALPRLDARQRGDALAWRQDGNGAVWHPRRHIRGQLPAS